MIFKETKLKGAYIIELEPVEDERGFFARSFCQRELKERGLNSHIAQCNISYNKKKGTLRGMHYQVAPYEEVKVVSCIRGAIYDVIIDLRQDSPTYCQWLAVELTAYCSQLTAHLSETAHSSPLTAHSSPLTAPYKMLYIPEGFAHGFQTLEYDTVVFYQMSEFYHPECARGVRWDDPAFGIEWPEVGKRIISEKDQSYSVFVL
ncbi:dTDP-4-dehydrorhamnose 3,5-epimerase family protein [Thermodesulfovibrionales bacterium]|nr:dTDP-4-dehydrorhamnose 3,5-epimerase family protein [Thermodesulfovibrionales bacterium]MCL0040034.1 dTDP-4-dehydrorhamnose 3,5-epimerase family protein [Thermodesulfovibrionales bacterium]MCL0083338.1 dTDP-4-dehydrorhamnose 3,5-epimerase family protein [Thermodesulfovibrionales bacterium]MCL0084853.1 dTDP-4-dehydrorhamnose 3,5-epimerase family protein [Thermodesulfovibrionales bacterium]